MKVKWCIVFFTIVISAIPSSADPSNAFEDNQDGRATRQLSLVTRQSPPSTTTVNIACAKLVNVTGACRRRRGIWIEEPIVLSFDEETEKLTDILFTPVYSIEPTVVPTMAVRDYPRKLTSGITVTNVENDRLVTSIRDSRNHNSPHARVNFQALLNMVTRLISAISPSRPAVQAPSTQAPSTQAPSTQAPSTQAPIPNIEPPVLIASQENLETVTVTNTFFIQLCTPSPFPFSECLQFRKRPLNQDLGR